MDFLKTNEWIVGVILLFAFLLYIVFSGLGYAFQYANVLALELKRDQKRMTKNSLGKLLDNEEIFWRTSSFMLGSLLILIAICSILMLKMGLRFFNSEVKNYFDTYDYMLYIMDVIMIIPMVYICKRWIAKPIFTNNPENKVNFWSRFIILVSNVINPVVKASRKVGNFILVYLFNARIDKKVNVFQEVNPNDFFRQSVQGHNVLNKLNKDFFKGAIDLTQVQARSCITPRTEIKAVDVNESVDELIKEFIQSKLSKIIVYEKHLDNIMGYVHHFDLHKNPTAIRDILIPLPVVPEAMSALDVVKIFTKDRKSMALVVDEFGGTNGVVTMEDILEEIFGNIKDEYDFEEFVEKHISDNEYVFSGRLKLDYLNDKYGFKFPIDKAETLSGFIISRHEAIPNLKQKIIIGRYEFEMLLVTNTKIESVRMKVFNI